MLGYYYLTKVNLNEKDIAEIYEIVMICNKCHVNKF